MLSIFISPFDLSRLASGLVFCLTVMLLSVANAENPAQTKTVTVSKVKPQTKKSKAQKTSVSELKDRKILNTIDANQEKQALAFAKMHHPELAELIQRLKKHKPREYKRAIRALDTTLANRINNSF